MRFLRVVLALVFGLAMASPEQPSCTHHQDGAAHHKAAHTTAAQACCPASVSPSVPHLAASWVAAPPPVLVVDVDLSSPGVIPIRKRLLPFALAPPLLS
jgi:hypothetical protein